MIVSEIIYSIFIAALITVMTILYISLRIITCKILNKSLKISANVIIYGTSNIEYVYIPEIKYKFLSFKITHSGLVMFDKEFGFRTLNDAINALNMYVDTDIIKIVYKKVPTFYTWHE
ncbi:hypothetical protein EST35_0338 [Pseudomonas phage vB_PaeM_PA5oct]|uniref:Uncharacterized protein n=1 Tax=Pseudomonas phage vB_PaeM_PA5oct TaxID=2163605 RepID=A0A4Y5JV14_9CAUD|nr:hypothetical protein PQE65_gp146 [Pseudomonas phage vB_PaeM_PA5oct]QCG76219.1 hypothetical protein EST35_0338 [Pseudomonas phage vB_PaeM_PA5oct]